MVDITTVSVAACTALATITSGLGGYWLAGRNDEARDIRTAAREDASRRAAFAEQRHEVQRQVLFDLQDELHRLTRATARILMQDRSTVREHGGLFLLPAGLSDDSFAATVAIQRLRSRILDDGLRTRVGDFVGFCSFANTDALIAHKTDPPEELTALINGLITQVGTRYADLVERLGEHIRRELDRP
jgi:hypothetical protein